MSIINRSSREVHGHIRSPVPVPPETIGNIVDPNPDREQTIVPPPAHCSLVRTSGKILVDLVSQRQDRGIEGRDEGSIDRRSAICVVVSEDAGLVICGR